MFVRRDLLDYPFRNIRSETEQVAFNQPGIAYGNKLKNAFIISLISLSGLSPWFHIDRYG